MGITKPYRRTCRQLTDGSYSNSGNGRYVKHPKYADSPGHYVRAFLVIQKDLHDLFDYVEPADADLACYSYRTHELLMRACIEVEANCTAILRENGYARPGNWIMTDYCKVDLSHKLSLYAVSLPIWHGTPAIRRPFAPWATNKPLPWYQAYNASKHDRHGEFHQASLENMLDAICGLVVILSSQFINEDFTGSPSSLIADVDDDGTESAIGGYFRVTFPGNWAATDRYAFDWQTLRAQPDPFQDYSYPP